MNLLLTIIIAVGIIAGLKFAIGFIQNKIWLIIFLLSIAGGAYLLKW